MSLSTATRLSRPALKPCHLKYSISLQTCHMMKVNQVNEDDGRSPSNVNLTFSTVSCHEFLQFMYEYDGLSYDQPQRLVIDIRSARDYQLNHLTGAKNVCCNGKPLQMRRMLLKMKKSCLDDESKGDGIYVYIYDSKTVDVTKPNVKRLLEILHGHNCHCSVITGGFHDLERLTEKTCGIDCNDIDSHMDYSRSPSSPFEGGPEVITAKASMILPTLFIGNESDSRNAELIQQLGISTIINVTNHLPNEFEGNKSIMLNYLRLPADDSHTQDLSVYFEKAADFIDNEIEANRVVMVHCWAGISRSCTIVMAYLIKYRGMTVMDAFNFVRERRPIVSPNLSFMGQLDVYSMKYRNLHLTNSDSVTESPAALENPSGIRQSLLSCRSVNMANQDSSLSDSPTALHIK